MLELITTQQIKAMAAIREILIEKLGYTYPEACEFGKLIQTKIVKEAEEAEEKAAADACDWIAELLNKMKDLNIKIEKDLNK
jgi:hypothetical protein